MAALNVGDKLYPEFLETCVSFFDKLLANKGAWMCHDTGKITKKGVISLILQEIFKLFFYRIDFTRM